MPRALATALAALLIVSTGHAADLTVAGAWIINRDLTRMPDERRPPDERGGDRERPRGPGGGGRGGFGGVGGRGMGGFGGGNGPSDAEMHRLSAIRDRLTEIPEHLIITRSDTSVTIADGFGRTATLKTDGKKQPRVTGEGEFTSKTRFDGIKLVVEDDFSGPKVTTTYEPVLEDGEIRRLIVTLKAENMPGAGREQLEGRGRPEGARPGRESRRVYDVEAK